MVYREVNELLEDENKIESNKTVTVSVDEKPGIQALKNIASDLPPGGKHRKIRRDYKYKKIRNLDNHSAYISKETMKYLHSPPNRFKYVHTPKHGSWLNLIEGLFSKMARLLVKIIPGGKIVYFSK